MGDVFQLLKYFDNFYNFTSHFIKSFPENINFANTISNCLMPEECTLFQIGKLDSHHSIMGSMMETFLRLVNGSNNQNTNFTHFYIFYVECKNFILIITPIYKSEECLH